MKVERKMKDGGNSEGVACVEGATQKGTEVAQTGKGSTTRIGTTRSATCIDR